MSVFIKGMKKPRNCGVCPFNEADLKCVLNGGWIDRDDYSCETKCPMIEVLTPHGRLIDADELTKEIKGYIINTSNLHYDDLEEAEACNSAYYNCLDEIEDELTIIEAESEK